MRTQIIRFLSLTIILSFTACLREAPPYEGSLDPGSDPNDAPTKQRIDTSSLEFNFSDSIGLLVTNTPDFEKQNTFTFSNLMQLQEDGSIRPSIVSGKLVISRFKITPDQNVIALIPQSLENTEAIGSGELCSLIKIFQHGDVLCVDSSGDKVQWRENNAFDGPSNTAVQFDRQGNIYYVVQRVMGGLNSGRIQSTLRKVRVLDNQTVDLYRHVGVLDDFVVLPNGNIFLSGLGDITRANSWFKHVGAGSNLNERRLIVESKLAESAPHFMKLVTDDKTKQQHLLVGMPGEPFGSDLNDAINFAFSLAMFALEGYLLYQTGGASAMMGPLLGNLLGGGMGMPGLSFGSSPLASIVSLAGGGIFGVGNQKAGGGLFQFLPNMNSMDVGLDNVEEATPVMGGLIVKGSAGKNKRELVYWDSPQNFTQRIIVDQNIDIRDDFVNPHGDRFFFRGIDQATGQIVLGEVDLESFVGRVIEESSVEILDLEFFSQSRSRFY